MKGTTEDSFTTRKRLSYISSDGMYLVVDSECDASVRLLVGHEEGEVSVMLSKAEAEELARFILAGVAR